MWTCPIVVMRPKSRDRSSATTSVSLFLCAPNKQISSCQRHETLCHTERCYYLAQSHGATGRIEKIRHNAAPGLCALGAPGGAKSFFLTARFTNLTVEIFGMGMAQRAAGLVPAGKPMTHSCAKYRCAPLAPCTLARYVAGY